MCFTVAELDRKVSTFHNSNVGKNISRKFTQAYCLDLVLAPYGADYIQKLYLTSKVVLHRFELCSLLCHVLALAQSLPRSVKNSN